MCPAEGAAAASVPQLLLPQAADQFRNASDTASGSLSPPSDHRSSGPPRREFGTPLIPGTTARDRSSPLDA